MGEMEVIRDKRGVDCAPWGCIANRYRFVKRRQGRFLGLFFIMKYTVIISLCVILPIASARDEEEKPRQCQEITIPMCRGIGYNMTYMPNSFNHESQEEAGLEVHQFWPLVKIRCSPDLKFFLCSMYAPICMKNYKKPLPACKSVCERAKAGCAPLMRQYGFAWPDRMNCDNFPVYGLKDQLCMDVNTTERSTPAPKPPKYYPSKPVGGVVNGGSTADGGEEGKGRANKDAKGDVTSPDNKKQNSGVKPKLTWSDVKSYAENCSCGCSGKLSTVKPNNVHYNRITTGEQNNCAISCFSPYFDDKQKTFSNYWIGLWSILCCIFTLMTMTTFFIDMERFKYPERPIIFLSGCYFMVSLGYIIKLIVGAEKVGCDGDTVRYETTGPALCTVVFLLVYFFGMASSIWWVILSFTWFLSAGLKWGQEAIARHSQYFHLAAWLIPSVKSIGVLAASSVDGDPVAGICYVGNQNLDNLRGFVLAPLFVYLIIGTSFLLAGFVSLFRIRNVIKQQGRGKTDKLEKLMIRIGVFSVLYTVPATIVISCIFYEQHLRTKWERSLVCPCETRVAPVFSVFMLKYFMCLVVGITSGFWIWTGKTLDSWKRFYGRLCNHGHDYTSRMNKYTNQGYQVAKQAPLSHV